MNSEEIGEYLKARNYILGGDEVFHVTSPINNPCISRVMTGGKGEGAKKDYQFYSLFTLDQCRFDFCVMPYEEAKKKGKVYLKR